MPNKKVGKAKTAPADTVGVPSRSRPNSFIWNRETAIGLARRLRELKIENRIRFRSMIRDSGIARADHEIALAQQRLSRWINSAERPEKWSLLRESDYRSIVSYLQSAGLLTSNFEPEKVLETFPDAMFHGTAQWLGMTEQSHVELRTCFPGTYTVYRHSLLKPGYIIVGRLTIEYDEQTKAVRTKENYTVDSAPSGTTKFELTGYIFRRNNRYRILSKHVGTEELQHIHIDSTIPRGGVERPRDVYVMSGTVSDIQEGAYYSTRIFFRREEPPAPLRTIEVTDADAHRIAPLLRPLTYNGSIVVF